MPLVWHVLPEGQPTPLWLVEWLLLQVLPINTHTHGWCSLEPVAGVRGGKSQPMYVQVMDETMASLQALRLLLWVSVESPFFL